MPSQLYEYRCTHCHRTELSRTRADSLGICFATLTDQILGGIFFCPGRLKRQWSFTYARGFAEHFNHTVGKPIRTMQQFRDELSRKGDEYSAYTGLDTNFQPVDPTDTATLGVTSEGLDSTNALRRRRGQAPILPDG